MTQELSKILVSSCLLGLKTNYRGEGKKVEQLVKLQKAGRVVFMCPEQTGGLSTPREPAEIEKGKTAKDILEGNGRILTISGEDVTKQFLDGARQTLEICQRQNIKTAILKARSPSCGSNEVYDGTHSGTKIPGFGVTAELLSQNRIEVFDEERIPENLQ